MAETCSCCRDGYFFIPPLPCTHRKFDRGLSSPPQQAWSRNAAPVDQVFEIITDPSDESVIIGYRTTVGSITVGNVTKHEKNGGVLWTWTYTPTSGNALILGIAIDASGNIFARGSGNIGLDNIFMLNSSGVQQWAHPHNNPSNGGGRGVCVDSTGRPVFTSGNRIEWWSASGTFQFMYNGDPFGTSGPAYGVSTAQRLAADDNGNVYAAIYTDISGSTGPGFAKFDSSGNLVWYVSHTNATGSTVGIAAMRDGSLVAGSGTRSTIDSGTVRCMDGNGNPVWHCDLGTSRIEAVTFDSQSNVYTLDIDGIYTKISPTGVKLWQGTHAAIGRSIHVSATGHLHVSGGIAPA